MTYRCARWGLLALFAATAACFDSDDKLAAVGTTTTGDPTTSTTGATTSTTDPTAETSGTTGVGTCRDAVDCIFDCAAAEQTKAMIDPNYEPDFSCFLNECIEMLPVGEVVELIRLGNCASEQCAAMGECSDGSESSSSGGSESSGSSGTETTTGAPPPPDSELDPCIQCIFILMLDEQYKGCLEFSLVCE